MYVWCVGVLVRSSFGLGGEGESENHIFGDVTLLRKHRNQKRASKEFTLQGQRILTYSSHPWTPARGRFSGQGTTDSEAPQGVGIHEESKHKLQAVSSSGVDAGYPDTGRQHFLRSRRPNDK